jgi:hypothetical protein
LRSTEISYIQLIESIDPKALLLRAAYSKMIMCFIFSLTYWAH